MSNYFQCCKEAPSHINTNSFALKETRISKSGCVTILEKQPFYTNHFDRKQGQRHTLHWPEIWCCFTMNNHWWVEITLNICLEGVTQQQVRPTMKRGDRNSSICLTLKVDTCTEMASFWQKQDTACFLWKLLDPCFASLWGRTQTLVG